MSISHKTEKNRGLSLILTLLIISSILTGTVLVAEVTIRHSQVVKGAEVSEKAFFATEVALEKTSYQIFKNYADITTYNLGPAFLSDGETEYSATASVDTDCPSASECTLGQSISNTNPWVFLLQPGESFQLDIDINGAVYPSSIEISRSGSSETDIVVYQCDTAGSPRVCSTTKTQSFSVTLPYTFNISDYSSKYYSLRINNVSASSSETYTLRPSSDLPVGVIVSANGTYSGYERKLNVNIPKWQKYGQ